MSFRARLLGLGVTGLVLVAASASAEPYRRPGLGGRWAHRHLTAPVNSLALVAGPGQNALFGQRSLDSDDQVRVIDGGFSYTSNGSEQAPLPAQPEQAWLRLGVVFGLTKDWEAGALFVPLQLAPDTRFGSILAYATRGFRLGRLDLGLRLSLLTPESGVWGLTPAGVARFRFAPGWVLDASLGAPLAVGDRQAFGLFAPVRVVSNPLPEFFFGLESGYSYAQRDDRATSTIPLGGVVGVTQLFGKRVFDFTILFSWDEFVALDPRGGAGPFDVESVRITGGLSVHQLVK